MNKATITTLEAMDQERIEEDIAMTPLERMKLFFQLSDLALEIHENQEPVIKESTKIHGSNYLSAHLQHKNITG